MKTLEKTEGAILYISAENGNKKVVSYVLTT